ncbi:hypothetical protein [Salinisphaera sp. G21_0]|uniref:hypothetical protein n=1 Tax=Salinisphaera sp. G21_0 TaxID=2821094 RepID=UPI001ADC75F9|nr:hypothetical protein [Salinisphaera sp. G21_0]MBO9484361.1 hypothetical protein [Salinisphaera sp. G21_0]
MKNVDLINPVSVKDTTHGRVMVVASGPSVSGIDFNRLSGFDFFMVNGSILALPEDKRYNYYYAIDDHFVLEERTQLVIDAISNAKISFVSKMIYETLSKNYYGDIKGKRICIIHRYDTGIDGGLNPWLQFFKSFFSKEVLQSPRGLVSAKFRKLGFSLDLERGYFSARTIPYVAAQISCYLGYSSIYFSGLDLAGSNRFYESGSNAIASTLDESFDRFIVPSFKFLSKVSQLKNIKFYNLSINSRLDNSILEKRSVSDLYS